MPTPATTHLTAGDTPIVAVKPVVVPAPGRGTDLSMRVTAPVTGRDLPVLLFSHGYGESLDGYGPLTDWWASQGFLVVQPTYLDSRSIGLAEDDGRRPGIWRQRVADAKLALDHLDDLVSSVPGLTGRVATRRIVAAGHSFGGLTTGILLGIRVADPLDGHTEDLSDGRVGAGVLMATAGRGRDLSPFAAEHFPFMRPDFTSMTRPALVVLGDRDDSPLSTRGPDWSADPYTDSPGEKHLLVLAGGEHSLGGIPGYGSAETTDEDPRRVDTLRRGALAFLRHTLDPDDRGWVAFRRSLDDDPLARLESKAGPARPQAES